MLLRQVPPYDEVSSPVYFEDPRVSLLRCPHYEYLGHGFKSTYNLQSTARTTQIQMPLGYHDYGIFDEPSD